ncbi:unnamed protein product [Phaeothamnion confervicola]
MASSTTASSGGGSPGPLPSPGMVGRKTSTSSIENIMQQLAKSKPSSTMLNAMVQKQEEKNRVLEFSLSTNGGDAAARRSRFQRSMSLSDADGYEGGAMPSLRHDQTANAINVTRKLEGATAAVGSCLASSSVKRDGKLIVAMVGIPARGKTFLAQSIKRHLDWIGLRSKVFSVAEYRRKHVAVWQPPEFFNHSGEEVRARMASLALGDALLTLRDESDAGTAGADIAIYDASNESVAQRQWLRDVVTASGLRAQVVFIESVCNDPAIVAQNIKETEMSSPEYAEMGAEEAEADFRKRIAQYERRYQPMEPSEGHQFIKIVDAGNQVNTNMLSGYVPGRLMMLLLNLHLSPRPIFMSRHGESEFNQAGRIGGDSPLTAAGQVYAHHLFDFMRKKYPEKPELVVWTSTMLRTGMTVSPMTEHWEVVKWRALDEINAGLMDGLTYEYVAENMPAEYEARKTDKLKYRYPRGESYEDVFTRLEPVLFEMLRQRSPLLIVGHQAILRVLYGYLMRKTPEECPTLDVPLHTVVELVPKAYHCEEEWFHPLDVVDQGGSASPSRVTH